MKKKLMLFLALLPLGLWASTDYIANVYGRDYQLLNGKWAAIVDLYDAGVKAEIYKDKKAVKPEEFYEYSFDGGLRLNVPGDWNSQSPELKYYEGTVWYARHFNVQSQQGKRSFLYFCGVSYRCNIYLNGEKIGSHEGSFTPFQIEVGDKLKDGDNLLVLEVNNRRQKDAIPAMSFDWWNYGGITRDVMLVTLPETYISDYFIRLDKHRPDIVLIDAELSSEVAGKQIMVDIPQLKRTVTLTTDAAGKASAAVKVRGLRRWSPDDPYLYGVRLSADGDTITDEIGFRNIEVRGTEVLLNGRPVFLRSVSFHEEIPQRMGRACTPGDAMMLLSEARDLGVNMVRLAHYQQNEYIVRQAERMGIMLWQEIPVWQAIDFGNSETLAKASRMLRETIMRDRNRCADCFWGIANETQNTLERNRFLAHLLKTGKDLDTTRLFVAAFDLAYFDKAEDKFVMHDDFYQNLDIVAINKYMGWYAPWPKDPADIRWEVAMGKPLFISEFGCEALYGQHGDENMASSWSEEYQAKLFRDNLRMFDNIPNLCGVSPWVLFDFRSPTRMHPTNQDGWNRKGLVSDQGQRKQAWYIMHDYYSKKKADDKSRK